MSLEVVEWDNHPSGRRRGAEGVDGGDRWSIGRISGDVRAIGGCTGEGKLAFEFRICGQGIGRASGGGRSVVITRAGWYELYLEVERVVCL